ncbi:MAG: PQQ-binding-like beta-propeller repeat protein, partial [Planctomycetota bacterium]
DPKFLYRLGAVRPGTHPPDAPNAAFHEEIYRWFDYGGNSVVAAGGKLAVVENRRPPAHLLGLGPDAGEWRNLLVAYDAASGKTLWGWDKFPFGVPADAGEGEGERRREDYENHARAVFLGPGVAWGGRLYTLVNESGRDAAVSLWAFDLRDGSVAFRTPIHYPDETRSRLPSDACIAAAGGTVYALTHSGIVAAIDARPPGRVRWIRRYTRGFAGSGEERAVEQSFAINDPVVTGGKLLVAAADAREVFALDAETGALLWSVDRSKDLGGVAHVVGVSQGTLVLAGTKLVGLDVDRGTKRWNPVALRGVPDGRGFVGERCAYVPAARTAPGRAEV